MIVVWFSKEKIVPLITCDLHKIGNTPFYLIHNRRFIYFPFIYYLLEVLTMLCYSNYFAYLLIGGVFSVISSLFYLGKGIYQKDLSRFKQYVSSIPKSTTRTGYNLGKTTLKASQLRAAEESSVLRRSIKNPRGKE